MRILTRIYLGKAANLGKKIQQQKNTKGRQIQNIKILTMIYLGKAANLGRGNCLETHRVSFCCSYKQLLLLSRTGQRLERLKCFSFWNKWMNQHVWINVDKFKHIPPFQVIQPTSVVVQNKAKGAIVSSLKSHFSLRVIQHLKERKLLIFYPPNLILNPILFSYRD